MPLTEIAVRKATPGAKTTRLFDGGGLYLEVAPSGGKWWRLKYRFAEKEKRLSLGVYPEVSLKQARLKRDDARRLLASGIDPSEQPFQQDPAPSRARHLPLARRAADRLDHRARTADRASPHREPRRAGNRAPGDAELLARSSATPSPPAAPSVTPPEICAAPCPR